MARILVTGGAGFIGSHLVDALVARNHDVVVVDSLTPQVHARTPDYLNPEAEYRFQDLRDDGVIPGALEDVEIVYHLASAVGVGQSMYRIEDYVSANTVATAKLLEKIVAERGALKRLIVASSMSVYGEGSYECSTCGVVSPELRSEAQLKGKDWELRCPEGHGTVEPIPTPESKPLAPTSIYAITKRDQEEMSLSIGREYGIPTVALRFFNVYGPRQALSNPYTGVCAIFQSRIQNGKPPIIFEDGRQTRDFVSVKDLIQACLVAGERSAAAYQVINVGTGRPTSILEVARVLLKLHGKELPLQVEDAYRSGDVRHCVADIRRARELLGYEPEVQFQEGLVEFVNWSQGQFPEDHTEAAYGELDQRGLVKK
jgi:dTDP-L-rhamnose 4-epimerase